MSRGRKAVQEVLKQASVINYRVSILQGYQEYWSEAAGPFEKNCLQHPWFKGPDQHPERVRSVILNPKGAKTKHWSSSPLNSELSWSETAETLWIGRTGRMCHRVGPTEPDPLTVHFWSLHHIHMGTKQTGAIAVSSRVCIFYFFNHLSCIFSFSLRHIPVIENTVHFWENGTVALEVSSRGLVVCLVSSSMGTWIHVWPMVMKPRGLK